MRSVFEASGFMVNDIIKHIENIGVPVKNIRMSGANGKSYSMQD